MTSDCSTRAAGCNSDEAEDQRLDETSVRLFEATIDLGAHPLALAPPVGLAVTLAINAGIPLSTPMLTKSRIGLSVCSPSCAV